MGVRIKTSRALGALSLTPLIDVVFLLLIFFLVATRFEEEERELDVSPPSASEAVPMISKPETLFVNVTKEGELFLGGEEVTVNQLERKLLQAWSSNPGRQKVVIRADKESKTENLVQVMNLCNKVKIHDYTVAAE